MINKTAMAIAEWFVKRRLSRWLAEPTEFGTKPVSIRVHSVNVMKVRRTSEEEYLFLLDYEMPDGSTGRGSEGFGAFSFDIDDIRSVEVESLARAYAGLGIATSGGVETVEQAGEIPEGTRALIESEGSVGSVVATEFYQLERRIIVEFTGERGSRSVKGACDGEHLFVVEESNALAGIPALYSLVGQREITSVQTHLRDP